MTAKRNNLKQHLSTAQLLKTSGLIIGNDEINNEEKTLPRDSARNYFDTSTSNIIKYLVREVRGNNNNDSKFDNSLVHSHYSSFTWTFTCCSTLQSDQAFLLRDSPENTCWEESYRSAMRTWNVLWICCSSHRKTLERFMSKVFNPFQITFLLAFFTSFIHSTKKIPFSH